MRFFRFIIFCFINYILGSIPWALVIGKTFYNTDIRNYHSGNLGATNAGRVLGKKAALIVFLLDALKGTLAFLVETSIDPNLALLSIPLVGIGHCWPVFANFKGGKAVSTTAGIIIAISLNNYRMFIFMVLLPLIIWLAIKAKTGLVSLGSICAVFVSALMSVFVANNTLSTLAIIILFVILVYRHKDNIVRLLNGTEKPTDY